MIPLRELEGARALVTGAGSLAPGIGNGRAAAILLARAGARVALVDLSADAARQTRDLIEEEGGVALVVPADVGDPANVQRAVATVADRFGGVDILVNNVGVAGPPGTAVDVDVGAWRLALHVNVTSMMLLAKHVVPHMARAGGGAVVNVSSIAALGGGHPTLLYPTAKGAIVSMTKAMAAHHGPQGIRVNCVAPGLVLTPMVQSRGMSDELREARRLAAPLETEGTGWDVGEAVLYLAGPRGRWVTGVVLPVDGGITATLPIRTPPRPSRTPAEQPA